jgi:hypothetical protein
MSWGWRGWSGGRIYSRLVIYLFVVYFYWWDLLCGWDSFLVDWLWNYIRWVVIIGVIFDFIWIFYIYRYLIFLEDLIVIRGVMVGYFFIWEGVHWLLFKFLRFNWCYLLIIIVLLVFYLWFLCVRYIMI